MAVLTGVVAVGVPAASALVSTDVVITAYGLRNTPQAGVTVEVHKSSNDLLTGTCTTAASGQCTITGLANNTGYYAKETAAVTPYSAVSQVWLGNSDGTGGVLTNYRKTFTTSNSSSNVALFVRRDNPVFPDRCGLKVALVIDTSGSTSGSQPAYQSAAKGFVDALAGTPSKVGVWSFATTAANQIGLTAVSNSAAIKAAIDSIPASNGSTNWDDGIYQVNAVGADVVVVITDGNPTANSQVAPLSGSNGSLVETPDVEGGVWAANSVKNNGAKIVVLGIGSGFSDATNIKLISGPAVNDDYYLAANVSGLNTLLGNLAKRTCGGTVTVQKQLQSTANGPFVNTAGWNYVPAISTGGGSIVANPASGNTVAPDGLVNFDFNGGTWPKTVTVTETPLNNQYALVAQAGKNAACTADGSPLTVANSGAMGVSFTLNQLSIVNCIFKNVKKGTINIMKATTGATGTFDFTGTGLTGGAGSITTTSGGGVASGNTLTQDVVSGVYAVAETPVSGWDTTSSCNDGSPVTAIAVNVGEVVTCTFNNVKKSAIIIQKATSGSTGTFTFTGAVPGSITTTTSGGLPSGTPLKAELTPGTYAVAETAVAGWDTTSSCSDGSPIGAVVLSPGETVTCTFTNVKQGTIVIKKATSGTTGTFAFTGAVPGSITTTTSDGKASGNELSKSVVPGTYAVAETYVDGWDTTSTCSNGSPVSAIVVPAGQTITCTFFNVKQGGIIIQKATLGDVGTFNFTGAVHGPITTTSANGLPSGNVLSANFAPGVYSVAETAVPGWDTTSSCSNNSPVTAITVAANETVTCTFVNVKRGSVVVQKATVGGMGTFAFTGVVAGSITTTDANGQPSASHLSSVSLVPGTYAVAETPANGWDTTSSCDNGSPTGAIVVAPGQTVTCTFINTKRGEIIVKKATVGTTGTFAFTGAVSGSLTTTTSQGAPSGGQLSQVVVPGTYAVAETAVTDWDTTSSCDNGSVTSAIVVAPGQTVTCTFVNTKRGTIVVRKATSGATGSFAFTGTVAGGITTITSDGVASGNTLSATVAPGANYSVAETLPSGWDLSSAVCSDGSPVTKIDVSANEMVTCTFTNVKRGSITIVKVANPQLADDFSFASPTLGGFTLDDDGNNTNALSNKVVFGNRQPGTYTVNELATAGWTLDSIVCSDANSTSVGSTATIVLDPGEDVICTFTNKAAPASIVVNKTAVGGDGTFGFSLDGVVDIALPATTTNGSGSTGQVALVPGTSFTISENDPGPAWIAGSLSCTVLRAGAAAAVAEPLTFSVLPGDAITCSVTNTKKGTVIIVKNVAGANGMFDFSGTFTTPAAFNITTVGNGQGGTGSQTFNNVAAGTYTVDELNIPANYDGTLTCVDSSLTGAASTVAGLTGTIRLDPGDTVTCTYTNTERGTIVIDKVTQPSGDPTQFGFTLSGSPAFSLADQTAALAVGSLVPNTQYTLTELAHTGWDFTGLTCVSSNKASTIVPTGATAAITLGAGDTVTCTYANSKLGAVTVDKELTSGPTHVAGNSYSVSYDLIVKSASFVPESFDLVDALDFGAGTTNIAASAVMAPGITAVAGWTGLDTHTALVQHGTIAAGATLTFAVNVTFDVAGGMTAAARDCLPPTGTGTLNSASVTVRGATSTDTACGEIPNPNVTITKTISSEPVRGANGVWTIGYDLTVTNASAAGPGSYILDDALQFGGGVTIQTVQASAVTAGLTVNPSFDGVADEHVASSFIAPGGSHVYRVTVTATVAVGTPGSGDCDPATSGPGTGFLNSAQITVQGATVGALVCRPFSTLTLVKNLINDAGGNATLGQFILSATSGGSAIINGPDPDAALNSGIGAVVPAGDYTLSETNMPGYAASNWSCTGGSVNGAVVTVTDGADVVCVVTNDDRQVDLQLTKSDGGASAVAGGGSFDYTLTIDNVGTRDADLGEAVVVTDQLPTGMAFVAFPSNCSVSGQMLTCNLDPADLQVADPAIVITVTVRLLADAPSGTYTNKAFVTTVDDAACFGDGCVPPCTAGEQRPSTANNTDCEDTPATREATISVTKTDSVSAPIQLGDSYSYQIVVTNNGSSTVTRVVLSDDLPGGLSLVSASGSDWTCNNVAVLRCTWSGTLAPGASTSILTVGVTLSTTFIFSQVVNTAVAEALVDDKGTVNVDDDVTTTASGSEHTPVAPIVASEPPTMPMAPPDVVAQLPRTGLDATRLLNLAGLLLAAGVALVQIVRRRRTAQ
ncbi:MAG: hypothetical protein QOE09_1747 [Ilumatobacteraceae bacterium]